jgi:hypothetical protein
LILLANFLNYIKCKLLKENDFLASRLLYFITTLSIRTGIENKANSLQRTSRNQEKKRKKRREKRRK